MIVNVRLILLILLTNVLFDKLRGFFRNCPRRQLLSCTSSFGASGAENVHSCHFCSPSKTEKYHHISSSCVSNVIRGKNTFCFQLFEKYFSYSSKFEFQFSGCFWRTLWRRWKELVVRWHTYINPKKPSQKIKRFLDSPITAEQKICEKFMQPVMLCGHFGYNWPFIIAIYHCRK